MTQLEHIARTALEGDSLAVRSLVQDWLMTRPNFGELIRPATSDLAVLALSASLAELFAGRAGEAASAWTRTVAPMPQATFLLRSASTMKRLRQQCEHESPAPLKRRNFFAPADYLMFA